jgi:hypothetical protein
MAATWTASLRSLVTSRAPCLALTSSHSSSTSFFQNGEALVSRVEGREAGGGQVILVFDVDHRIRQSSLWGECTYFGFYPSYPTVILGVELISRRKKGILCYMAHVGVVCLISPATRPASPKVVLKTVHSNSVFQPLV